MRDAKGRFVEGRPGSARGADGRFVKAKPGFDMVVTPTQMARMNLYDVAVDLLSLPQGIPSGAIWIRRPSLDSLPTPGNGYRLFMEAGNYVFRHDMVLAIPCPSWWERVKARFGR